MIHYSSTFKLYILFFKVWLRLLRVTIFATVFVFAHFRVHTRCWTTYAVYVYSIYVYVHDVKFICISSAFTAVSIHCGRHERPECWQHQAKRRVFREAHSARGHADGAGGYPNARRQRRQTVRHGRADAQRGRSAGGLHCLWQPGPSLEPQPALWKAQNSTSRCLPRRYYYSWWLMPSCLWSSITWSNELCTHEIKFWAHLNAPIFGDEGCYYNFSNYHLTFRIFKIWDKFHKYRPNRLPIFPILLILLTRTHTLAIRVRINIRVRTRIAKVWVLGCLLDQNLQE